MVRVIFQAKVHTTVDCSRWVEVPRLCLQHCVVEDFKAHPSWRKAISSLELDGILEEYTNRLFGGAKRLDLNAVPEDVSVDVFGALAIVTIDLMQGEQSS
ncbi:TPA: hypothetical protein ACSP2E_004358 [Aeromonas hydrophila]